VGCVYTAQGFEFDYVGVIWGRDLTYRFAQQRWFGDKTASHDNVVKRSGDRFSDLITGCRVCTGNRFNYRPVWRFGLVLLSLTRGIDGSWSSEANDVKSESPASVDEQRRGRFQKAAQRLHEPGGTHAIDDTVVE
jgi:hypothetical protein